jgi:hypothetical protein
MSDTNADLRGQQRYTGGGDSRVVIGADINKQLLVQPGGAAYAEVSRRTGTWTVGTATLFAPLVAYPTTTAALEVWNGGSRTMVIKDLYASWILATAVVSTYAIYAMVTTTKAVPSLTALSIFSNAGKSAITPTAASEAVTGVGTTVVANGWRPYGDPMAWGLAAAFPGNGWSADVDGALIVPPRASVCVHVVGNAATASSFQAGLTFYWDSMTVEA